MKHKSKLLKVFWVVGIGLVLQLALQSNANAQFFDDFSSPTLDPAWTVVQTWPGGVPRAYYWITQPGNHYSLTDNPGYLRFWLDPMTHWDGFLNGYQTTDGYHSCCTHDASLEIHRQFSGNNWRFEAGGIFHLPFSNGRCLAVRLYFGTGAVPTYWVQLYRGADVHVNRVGLGLYQKTGPALVDQTILQDFTPNGDWYYGTNNYPTPAPLFFRVERAGGVLTAYWSDDGIAWNAAWSHDMGSALDGLEQRVVVTGYTWFNTYDSFADWDYISVASDNQPPVADAGPDQTVSANASCQGVATLNGTGSTDPDGDALTYTWSGPFGTATGETPTVNPALGTHTITLTVDDGKGGTATDTVDVTVYDGTPPTIGSLSATPNVLWPPNHNMVAVTVRASVLDSCDPAPTWTIVSVTSNEPANGLGDGDLSPDWMITGNHTVSLRAERSGTGNGRIYTITVQATDASGNISVQSLTVSVPKNQKAT